MSYSCFFNFIDSNKINIIFELGSRDLIDAVILVNYFNKSKIYSFECNPDCLIECHKNMNILKDENIKNKINLIEKAVSINNGIVSFYPYDLKKYNNMGASSMLIVDFTMRNIDDPDYYNENPQIKINVDGIRLDTFINQHNIDKVDMLCIDLQGYELNAIKSLGDNLKNVKYIITECSIHTTYIDGSTFKELNDYLNQYNFKYIISNKFGYNFPDLSIRGFSEFDALFINQSIK